MLKRIRNLEKKLYPLEDISDNYLLPTGMLLGIASNITQVLKSALKLTDHQIPNLGPFFTAMDKVGDFIWTAGYPFLSNYLSDRLTEYGKTKNSKLIEKIGKYFNEISIPLVTAYFVISETVYNLIPLNVMDPKDSWAAIVGGVIGYLAFRSRKRHN